MNDGMEMVEIVKTCCCTLVVLLCVAVQGTAAEPIPAVIMGQNIEHTRSAVQGGLSAQLVRNRKFAGILQRDVGVRGGGNARVEWF